MRDVGNGQRPVRVCTGLGPRIQSLNQADSALGGECMLRLSCRSSAAAVPVHVGGS